MLCVAPLALDDVVAVIVEDVLEVAPPDELPVFMARLKLVLYICKSGSRGHQHIVLRMCRRI